MVAIAVAALMFSMSGYNAVMGYDGTNDQVADEFEDEANGSVANEDFEGDGRTDNSGTLVGFITSGVGRFGAAIKLVALLPAQLETMGFPRWFAYPVGLMVQFIAGLGFVQFATNRVFR